MSATYGTCALQFPSSYVIMDTEEMEYLDGGAESRTCDRLSDLWMSILGATGGASVVYASVKTLATISLSAVKAALATWVAGAALISLTYYALEITTACIGLKTQGHYTLNTVLGFFDYVTL